MASGEVGVAEELSVLFPDEGDVWRLCRYLRRLPLTPRLKKVLLWEWCRWRGVDVTSTMVVWATGYPAGEY